VHVAVSLPAKTNPRWLDIRLETARVGRSILATITPNAWSLIETLTVNVLAARDLELSGDTKGEAVSARTAGIDPDLPVASVGSRAAYRVS
jgi:hypothetical protein